MSNIYKNFLFALSFLPFLTKLPYIVDAYETSPLERYNSLLWIGILFFIPISEYIRRKKNITDSQKTGHTVMVWLLGFSALAWLGFYVMAINALCIIFGVIIVALSVEIRFGRRVFASLIPCYLIAILATPSVGYWLDYYLSLGLNESISLFLVKIFVVLTFALAWFGTAILRSAYPRLISLAFCTFAFSIIIFGKVYSTMLPAGNPLWLNFENLSGNNYWAGTDMELSDGEKRFFRGSKSVSRKIFYSDKETVGVLELEVGKNISNIHPAGICLKSSGWKINSVEKKLFDIDGKKMQIAEIKTERDSENLLMFSWFSDETMSLGDFVEFRFAQKNGKQWRHYQIMTKDNPEASKVLLDFIKVFYKPPTK